MRYGPFDQSNIVASLTRSRKQKWCCERTQAQKRMVAPPSRNYLQNILHTDRIVISEEEGAMTPKCADSFDSLIWRLFEDIVVGKYSSRTQQSRGPILNICIPMRMRIVMYPCISLVT